MDRQEWLHCSAATLAAESNFLIPKNVNCAALQPALDTSNLLKYLERNSYILKQL
jgi:hypothetical protein